MVGHPVRRDDFCGTTGTQRGGDGQDVRGTREPGPASGHHLELFRWRSVLLPYKTHLLSLGESHRLLETEVDLSPLSRSPRILGVPSSPMSVDPLDSGALSVETSVRQPKSRPR